MSEQTSPSDLSTEQLSDLIDAQPQLSPEPVQQPVQQQPQYTEQDLAQARAAALQAGELLITRPWSRQIR